MIVCLIMMAAKDAGPASSAESASLYEGDFFTPAVVEEKWQC